MIKRQFHRRNFPHLYYNEGIYFVTFRLYGSINPNELKKLNELVHSADKETAKAQHKIFKCYDSLLDKPENKI